MKLELKKLLQTAEIGDLVYTDGDSGFCQGGWDKITDTRIRYDEKSGEKDRQLRTNHWFSSLTGHAVTPPYAYYISGFKSHNL